MREDSSVVIWPEVKSFITIAPSAPGASETRFMRNTTSPAPIAIPWLAASIGARPVW
jgi:hypothetical protein